MGTHFWLMEIFPDWWRRHREHATATGWPAHRTQTTYCWSDKLAGNPRAL